MPDPTPGRPAPPLEFRASPHFVAWLAESQLSLAFSTYQTNRLFLLGRKPDGRLSVFERFFDRPMGLHATSERLIMSTRYQLWTFDDALPPGDTYDGFDRVYVPRHAQTTGDLDVHDVALDSDGRPIFVNTAYSCLATPSERYSFTPLWQPPFVSGLTADDRCHLNGLAMADGVAAYVTAVSATDVAGGWRDHRRDGGIVVDVRANAVVLRHLSMPHSPRIHQRKLWVLNSGSGELGLADVARGRFEPAAFCPGFLRGLAFTGDFAIVGVSKQRQDRTFSGLPLDERLQAAGTPPRCGLWVIDLARGEVAHWFELDGVVSELYDVQVLPGVVRPMAVGFKTDEIQRLITIDLPNQPMFHALATPPTGAGGAPPPNPPPADASTLNRLGVALYEKGRLAAAKECFEHATVLAPLDAEAYNNLGGVLQVEERFDEALRLHARAVELVPDFALGHENVGKIHEQRCRIPDARTAYGRALAIRPDPVLALHRELLCPPVFASAAALDAYRRHAEAAIDQRRGTTLRLAPERVQASRAEPPYDWAYHGRDDLSLRRKYAALFADGFSRPPLDRGPPTNGPWRVAFVATPGHEGVFARCMAGILNRLDPKQFEVLVMVSRARGVVRPEAIRNPAVRVVDLPLRFDQAAARLRAARLDVIYYWEVGTDSTNYFLPFLRLASVQCTGWGWPETSAAPALDHHLSSAVLAPPGTEHHYSEGLIRLPELPPYFHRPPIPTRPHPPSHFGLSDDAHLYVCAQTLRKIHPDFDPLLAGILRRDPRGVAVFVSDQHPALGELLRARWAETLPDVLDRIVLLPRLSPDDYFHLLAGAHVSLDPLHFGGANTAYDAVAAGLPMVTLPTEQPRGRYVAALMAQVGGDEVIATTTGDYVERAVALGTDPALRARVGAQIREHSPRVFEVRGAVEQLERFFVGAVTSSRR